MQTAHAPATARHDGVSYYFCSDHCQHRFTAGPARFSGPAPSGHADHGAHPAGDGDGADHGAIDPVCGMTVDPATAAAHAGYAGHDDHFCGQGCADHFAAGPLGVLAEAPDPVCGMTVHVADAEFTAERDGTRYVFCGAGCRGHFAAAPSEPADQH